MRMNDKIERLKPYHLWLFEFVKFLICFVLSFVFFFSIVSFWLSLHLCNRKIEVAVYVSK